MMTRLITVCAVLLGVLVTPGGAAAAYEPAGGRSVISLDHSWRFHKGDAPGAERPGYDDTGWQRVTLPHTWNAADGEDGGSYYRGPGWYRRDLAVPASVAGRRLFLQFDGANLVTDVWLNGRKAGRHKGGYAAFRFDITDLVEPGESAVVAVRVDNSIDRDTMPLMGDFTMFGGLHRGVRLLATSPVHVDALDHGGPGVYVRQRAVSAARADLAVTSRVTNDSGAARTAPVRTVVTDHRNRVVATAVTRVEVSAGATAPVTQQMTVRRPRLWQGREDPYLYRVHVVVAGDRVSVPLGIRAVEIDPDRGVLLNGKPVELRGVNIHAMRPGKGYAISKADIDRDVAVIEEMGANALRLAHYQHPQRIYDLADRRGLLVWTEIPLLGALTASEAFFDNAQQQLLELMRQNHHHPSVVVWGAGNELYTNSADANRLLGELAATIRREDPERPSSYAYCCFSESDPLASHTDTLSHNLYFGWYYGTPADMGPWADRMHASFPERPIAVSEYGAGASVVQPENPPRKPDPAGEFHPEEWQALYHEGNWNALRSRPFVWGKFIWLMYDFASDSRDEGDRPGLNDKGLVTADRKIRKDAFYWYQANWSSKPVVHITARRDTPRFTPTTHIKVYANTGPVSLTINGVSLGSRTPEDHVATWSGVRLRPGANTVEARSGRTVDRVTWWLDTSEPGSELEVDAGGGGDHNATDGVARRVRGSVGGTDDRTYREGTFGYRLPVVNGRYDVELTFVEPDSSGSRVFTVNAERQRRFIGLDVAAEVGPRTALRKRITVEVTDGVLDLEFVPIVGDALVSTISVTPRTEVRR